MVGAHVCERVNMSKLMCLTVRFKLGDAVRNRKQNGQSERKYDACWHSNTRAFFFCWLTGSLDRRLNIIRSFVTVKVCAILVR